MGFSQQLIDLAERCERATAEQEMFAIDCEIERIVFDKSSGLMRRFTVSLDAAMTLVPEGWRTAAAHEYEGKWLWRLGARDGHPRYGRGGLEGFAVTHTLALCAAALRARGIDARSGETGTGSIRQDESPVGEADAPNSPTQDPY